jgi:hypothetical protein
VPPEGRRGVGFRYRRGGAFMESYIALAVQDMHSSCSETSLRASSRVRVSIPAVTVASYQGTTVPAAFPLGDARFVGAMTHTDGTTKLPTSGYLTWSPPV